MGGSSSKATPPAPRHAKCDKCDSAEHVKLVLFTHADGADARMKQNPGMYVMRKRDEWHVEYPPVEQALEAYACTGCGTDFYGPVPNLS